MGPEAIEVRMSSPLRAEMLEKQAERQRNVMEGHVIEFRQRLRSRLDVKRNVREHVWPLTGVLAVIGLGLGYSLIGIFTRK